MSHGNKWGCRSCRGRRKHIPYKSCYANQWTGFYITGCFVMKELMRTSLVLSVMTLNRYLSNSSHHNIFKINHNGIEYDVRLCEKVEITGFWKLFKLTINDGHCGCFGVCIAHTEKVSKNCTHVFKSLFPQFSYIPPKTLLKDYEKFCFIYWKSCFCSRGIYFFYCPLPVFFSCWLVLNF